MRTGSLGALLAIALATACASFHRMPVPNWPRYQDGELTGFLHAPGERAVNVEPELVVRRARGRMGSPFDWRESGVDAHRRRPATRTPEGGGETVADVAAVDTRTVVVELRGPGSSPRVRTLATRNGAFDFGPLPSGTYTLKSTVIPSAGDRGWSSTIRTIILSDSADAVAEIGAW